MKLEFTLTQDDFLQYHLYADATSTLIGKQKKRITYGLAIAYVVLGILMTLFWKDSKIYIGFLFIGVGVVWFWFYPKLFRYKRKQFYKKYVEELYTHRIHQKVTLVLESDGLYSKVTGMESNVSTSQLTSYIELKDHFLIGLTTGAFFNIPKHAIADLKAFNHRMESYAIPYTNALDWKW